jgi:hypothetical protein
MIVVTVVMLKAVADLILAFAGQAREIGLATSPPAAESRR